MNRDSSVRYLVGKKLSLGFSCSTPLTYRGGPEKEEKEEEVLDEFYVY